MKTVLKRNAVWMGAVAGAVITALVQVAAVVWFYLHTELPILYRSPSDAFFAELRNLGFVFGFVGAILGGCSSAMLLGFYERDQARVRANGIGAAVMAVFVALPTILFLSIDSILARPLAQRTFIFCSAWLLNFPLQWSIALAVAARVAANRLRREAKRDGS